MLAWKDVFDVKRRQGRGFLGKTAILTPISGSLTYKCFESRIHHVPESSDSHAVCAANCLRALDCRIDTKSMTRT